MRLRNFITTFAALLVLGGCTIEPPLHLRKAAATKVVLKTSVKAQGGKVAFRGFRGKYRITWKDADGREHAKIVDVK